VVESRKGDVVLGKGEGYAISSNVQVQKLDDQVTALAEKFK